ncbi:MAG: hypothetical protein M5R40_27400 [Anaerolineae bacterium]|nr:hypothetical protein [Anaerolineae bacterium]
MRQGIYDRNGEPFAYLEGDKVFDLNGQPMGVRRGQVIYDMQDEQLWSIEGDGLWAGNQNVGYLGAPLLHDD